MNEPPTLLALTPGDLQPRDLPRFRARLESAVQAGLAGVLLREPGLGDRVLLQLALQLRDLLHGHDAAGADAGRERRGWLGVHDRVHVALAVEADALHLGFRSLALATVRRVVGQRVAIGLSTHAADDEADWDGADYLFHGPVRLTASKVGWCEPVGSAGLQRACRRSALPVWAIGGLRPEDAGAVLRAGARGMAVRGGILAAQDPGAATRAFLQALGQAP